MRLKNYSEAPVGGWYYSYEDKDGNKFVVKSTGIRQLISATISHMRSNSFEAPQWIAEAIEDQICQRQPEGKCWYTKNAGDQLSKIIHKVAGGIDAAAESIGLKPQLKKKARGCSACGQRRIKMNQWGNK